MKYDELIKSLHICGDNTTTSCRGCLFAEIPMNMNCRKMIMNESANAIDDMQKQITSVGVAEVKHGEWKWRNGGECSECGFYNDNFDYNFCPNCGADMRCEIVEDRPLVEVPKHGRLIDADALPINTGWLEVSESTHDHITFVYATDIYSAKTIIEAND